jgi:hypothetical protein
MMIQIITTDFRSGAGDPATNCLGDFDIVTAERMRRRLPAYAAAVVEDAALAGSRAIGRRLTDWERQSSEALAMAPHRSMLNTAAELRAAARCPMPQEGTTSFVWLLDGQPGLVLKVLGSPQRAALRSWSWSISIANTLEPLYGLHVPRVRERGSSPIPWAIHDLAPGPPATISTMSPEAALNLVENVQRTTLFRGPRLQDWGRKRYAANIEEPLAALRRSGVVSDDAARRAGELVREHLDRVTLLDRVLAHNDLALHHIFPTEVGYWLIDWTPHWDRLGVLDIAHLMINHGALDMSWARRLGSLAISRKQTLLGADVRSNLLVCLMERAVGMAFAELQRRAKQSVDSVDILCAIIEGELVGTAS